MLMTHTNRAYWTTYYPYIVEWFFWQRKMQSRRDVTFISQTDIISRKQDLLASQRSAHVG